MSKQSFTWYVFYDQMVLSNIQVNPFQAECLTTASTGGIVAAYAPATGETLVRLSAGALIFWGWYILKFFIPDIH